MVGVLEDERGEVFDAFFPRRISDLLSSEESVMEFLRNTASFKILRFEHGSPVLEFFAQPNNPQEADEVTALLPSSSSARDRSQNNEDNLCGICLTRPRDTVFGCGHRCCGRCAARIPNCFACRLPITHKIRIY